MSEPTGTIHDLGYKRYLGSRRARSTRWTVIMRHQIQTGWKKWWRYKLALFFTVITTFIAGGFMYFAAGRMSRQFGTGAAEAGAMIADIVVPGSIQWYCRWAFVLSLTLGSTIIASDTQSGAFNFYYVRSIRPLDYVIGKLAGYGTLVATLVILPPLALAFFRLGMSENTDELIANLWIVPKVLAIGALATLVYTAVPLAISALIHNRRYALALWAAYYLIGGIIIGAIAFANNSGAIGVLDLQVSIQTITYSLFDVKLLRGNMPLEPIYALISLFGQFFLAVGVIYFQVSRDQKSGVGGSS